MRCQRYDGCVSTCRSCMLQAESEKLRQAWIQAVQASIASAYKDIADNYYIEVGDFTVLQQITTYVPTLIPNSCLRRRLRSV